MSAFTQALDGLHCLFAILEHLRQTGGGIEVFSLFGDNKGHSVLFFLYVFQFEYFPLVVGHLFAKLLGQNLDHLHVGVFTPINACELYILSL